jgi:hypothetical protein
MGAGDDAAPASATGTLAGIAPTAETGGCEGPCGDSSATVTNTPASGTTMATANTGPRQRDMNVENAEGGGAAMSASATSVSPQRRQARRPAFILEPHAGQMIS